MNWFQVPTGYGSDNRLKLWLPGEAFHIHLQVLLWDEPFNSEEIGNVGVVGTNDEITRTFFSNTKVQVEFI